MADSRIELALKKQRLQLQCQAQREVLAERFAGLAPAFHAADSARAGLDWLKARPLIPLAAAAGLAITRPRKIFRLALRGFSIWRTVRSVKSRFGAFL